MYGSVHDAAFCHQRWRRLLLLSTVISLVLVLLANVYVLHEGRQVYTSIQALPKHDVGLLLGTSLTRKNGQQNWYCTHRIEAAVALFRAGKIRHLLVSGDNHIATYDEPSDIRRALMARGIPASAITVDDAGFHTLDSIVRAQRVFQLTNCTIISQADQDARALTFAAHIGLAADAFAAQDVSYRYRIKNDVREIFSRTWCVLDLMIVGLHPHFLGPPLPITVDG